MKQDLFTLEIFTKVMNRTLSIDYVSVVVDSACILVTSPFLEEMGFTQSYAVLKWEVCCFFVGNLKCLVLQIQCTFEIGSSHFMFVSL